MGDLDTERGDGECDEASRLLLLFRRSASELFFVLNMPGRTIGGGEVWRRRLALGSGDFVSSLSLLTLSDFDVRTLQLRGTAALVSRFFTALVLAFISIYLVRFC